jgi:nicotinamidase-related amidase
MSECESSRDWRTFLPAEEAETYRLAGFAGEDDLVLGDGTGLLVVDCTVAFTGRSPVLDLRESIAEFPTACGPVSWPALECIARLLVAFRARELPVVFSRSAVELWPTLRGATKGSHRRTGRTLEDLDRGNQFPDLVAPQSDELILEKTKASVFFATPLATYLSAKNVDTLVVCGTTTSGCVRASVVDSFSHGFRTIVVDAGCFDRSPTAHRANLWDMHAKYADVVGERAVLDALGGPRADRDGRPGAVAGLVRRV